LKWKGRIHIEINIKGLLPSELKLSIKEIGKKEYRASQLLSWVYKKGIDSFDEMSDLPLEFREVCKKRFALRNLDLVNEQVSEDGTTKYLFKLKDGNLIESVLIPGIKNFRNTVCVSTQVGCAFGCRFCASGKKGFKRDLSAGEIVDQALFIKNRIKPHPVTNIVIMGVGEPLSNYDNLLKAIRIFNSHECLNIGIRKITISTCGIVPEILRLASENMQVELSISLHASDDAARTRLMPINKRYPISKLIETCKEYILKTNRQITFEYILLKGINDSPVDAKHLIQLLKGVKCKVNLIPYNEVEGVKFESPGMESIKGFRAVLNMGGVRNTLRLQRGLSIKASCGQLRMMENIP